MRLWNCVYKRVLEAPAKSGKIDDLANVQLSFILLDECGR